MPQHELILRVKEAKAATGITYKEIEEKTKEIGSPVSESSIKRIFAEGSENKMTRNDKTLMPIASVLLAPEVMQAAMAPKKETQEESLDIIAMKDDRIEVLKRQMATKETEYLEKIADLNRQLEKKDEDHKELVAVLNRQIDKMEATTNERIAYFKERMARGDRIIRALGGTIGVLLLAIIVALIIDNLHPTLGWIREGDSTFIVIFGSVVVLAAVTLALKFLRKK